MDTRDRSVWSDFDRYAQECLRRSSFDLGRYPVPPLARALVLPALGTTTGYALYRVATDSIVGVSLRWGWARDERSIARMLTTDVPDSLEPHVTSSAVSVDSHGVDELTKRLLAARVPAMPGPGSIGLDGVSYELAFGEWYHGARFHWWLQPPSGWQPLGAFLHGMIQLIDTALAQLR